MTSSLGEKASMKEKGLRYHLLIIEFLVVVIPFVILFYIFYAEKAFLKSSQMILIALTLLLILAGLIILRRIFDRFSLVAISLKNAEGGEKALVRMQQDTAELQEIAGSFNNLMNRLEETTSELQHRVFELFTIKELTEVAGRSLDIEELLNMLLEKAMAVSKAQIGSVLMVEFDKNRFRVVTTRGLEPGPRKGSHININDTLLQHIVSEKKPLLVQDIESDPRIHKVNDLKYGAPSFLSMPIFIREDLVGVLNLSHKQTQQVFDSHDEHIVSIMIGEIGFALENARLHLQVVEHVKNLEQTTVELTNANDQLRQEITERKQIEVELEDTNKFLKNILGSSSSISIVSTDLEQNVLFWNKGAENIFGYKAEEIVGRQKIDILYPDDETKEIVNEIRSLIAKDKKNMSKEVKEITREGRTLWVNLNLTPSFDERGNVMGILGIGEDITERKEMDESLRESEEKYRTILESIEEGYFEVDLTGNFTFLNDALCKISGYTRDELLGMNNRQYTAPETTKKMYQIFNQVYRTGKLARVMDYEIITKDRSTKILEMSAYLIQGLEGAPIGFRGVVRDVTERKEAEEEKKTLEAKLQYAQKMEALGTLAGGIAHNFNNLLMGILGNTTLMLLGTDSGHPHYEKLKIIEKLVDSGSKLTKQLLGYARKGRYEIKPLIVNRLIEETSETFRITKKDITVHRELANNLHVVQADQGQIEQVLWNLYVNAADAMSVGGELFLETRNVTSHEMKDKPYKVKPGNYVLVTVRDTGTGIDKKTMERIFEPFFSTKGLAKGTGLGLASVYGMVKAHGGYIDVESKKGRGSTFNIYLPASEKQVLEKKVTQGKIEKGHETLLLVDDEEMILEVSREILEILGYTVIQAQGGKEAIDLYRANKDNIDMVILDMIMPDMGGGETYDQLKAINPELKALLSSGYSIDGQAKEILERGCDGFIQKPFNMKELSGKIREILDKK
ncbi:MAG: PAS domain S-box protein [Deltaproteobacteria bacterium]|nr:PAS domain S-box protein [Deltaproteobacteria bacterium]